MTGTGSAVPTGAILELLSDSRRRRLLGVLSESPEDDTTLYALADELAATDSERDGDPTWQEIAVDLHHVHLPKLAAAGVIDYNARNRQVRYRGHDVVERLLAAVDDERGPDQS